MSNIGRRYREFLDGFPTREEARRRIVECARRHGVMAAVRMSGATRRTVRYLVIRAEAGDDLARDAGRQPMSARDGARTVAAKRAHPHKSVRSLKKNHGLLHGSRQIYRVLHEAGLLKKRRRRRPTRDPGFWIRWHEKQCLFAQVNFYLGMIARLRGYTGRLADTDTPLRRMRLSERKLAWWKERQEKARREGERSPPDAIMTSAVPGRPGTPPDPDRADESERTHAEMVACLAKGVKLAASALESTMADIRQK